MKLAYTKDTGADITPGGAGNAAIRTLLLAEFTKICPSIDFT
jgi:hypothetical protein